MATLASKIIAHLGRTPDFETEVILQDDGSGVYLKTWNAVGPEPTSAQLDAADGAATTAEALQTVQNNRRKEYPSVADQLDKIYHDGINEWKKVIKATKDKYPKSQRKNK